MFRGLSGGMRRKAGNTGNADFLVPYMARIERMAGVLGGIPVWEVLPDSAGAAAGLLFGDIILSVNRTPTPTFEAFLAAGRRHLDDLEFEVFRDGQVLALRPCA
jgi:S1-C subfamily serine protease